MGTLSNAEEVRKSVEQFLAQSRQPWAVETGETPIQLTRDSYAVSTRGDRCLIEAWGHGGNLVRWITAVTATKRGRLDLRTSRFGAGTATLLLVDRALQPSRFERDTAQARFREFMRRLLIRHFSGWKITRLSTARDLERSLSPLFARGVIHRGSEAWAVIAGPQELGSPGLDQILTFGLIWLDLVRNSERERTVRGLRLILPEGRGRTTANRLPFLNKNVPRFELCEFSQHGGLKHVDERDYGNLATELNRCLPLAHPEPQIDDWIGQLRVRSGVEAVLRPDGLLSLRVRGIQFALAGRGVMTYGLDRQRPVGIRQWGRVLKLADELGRFRAPDASDAANPLYRKYPERWLESQVRANLTEIDGTLHREPLYDHVPAVAGADRGIIDLLASDMGGRLAVLELKASEDLHLPLQGLDYWMRVKWHLERGDFDERGFFPGREISKASPRLMLVAPALDFHPTTEVVLSYFSPSVPVERVGVGADWRRELRVAFRQQGARRLA